MTPTLPRINCPRCDKKDTWKQNNPHRPFCSEVCKLIDLGKWADESYKVADKTTDTKEWPKEDEPE